MRSKRKYRSLSDSEAYQIVRAYHEEFKTQLELAEMFGVDNGYVSRLVHGDARPEIYRQVEADLAEKG